mmetsp:Transcript_3849/g.12814  ORF Transcript_3849/g.12814 Transcript_3849/m.12814 type:complete len:82 (-) Transcript_3849:453-698(-)
MHRVLLRPAGTNNSLNSFGATIASTVDHAVNMHCATLKEASLKRSGSAPWCLETMLRDSRFRGTMYAGNVYKGTGGTMLGM